MKNNESKRDKIVNKILYWTNCLRVFLRIKRYGNQHPDTSRMKLVFSDEFSEFDNTKWRIGQAWGKFHPDYAYQYYGNNAVSVKDNSLELHQFYSPKELQFGDNPKVYNIPQSVGLVTSIDSFGYGFYRVECKLPKGIGLWPAVWLSCATSWPPEIDILEAYSNESGGWGKDLQSNFHYDFDQNKKQSGARNHPVVSTDDKLVVGCHFTKDFIKIYYNGYLVRQITGDDILKFFRDKKMVIILNNAIRAEYKDKLEIRNQKSEFLIYSVYYYESKH